jgi:hypothetical protein
LDDSAFGADSGAADGGGLGAGDEGDDRGNLFGCLKTLQERTWARGLEKFLFDFYCGDASLFGHAFEKT